ncbi:MULTISPECIES: DNA alkylation repair protein [Microbacterium]|uniref:DNA alkylation repair protein n=1 Tax=Microbacterium TaxID=33882 RepID=UPI000F5E19FF|nr:MULTISPECIES: DNA alkylation repair protein [Microbacterium]AZH77313.1 DNA alkylation repair protein [Microbacterium sp. Y-01]MDX2399166.1 DNA alkylation repair protein [Microbacterium algeriense]
MADMTVTEALGELAALEDPKMRAANEKRGDDHGMNLSRLRALAKRIKTDQPLARELWATGETPARLLALLICTPRAFTADELDAMLREPLPPKVDDWFVNYVLKKSPHAEELRLRWFDDADPTVAAAAWSLTTVRVTKDSAGLDLPHLLDLIERDLKDAPSRLQWAMNETLANIGIFHPELRTRALEIGERLQVLADYPTAPGCTSPFAPLWIGEIVRRREG